MQPITIDTPIKINLALHVIGQRGDGYHLLESFVTFAQKGDRLTIEPSERDEFITEGQFAGQFSGDNDENLVIQARNILRKAAGARAFPVKITLEKNLPISSGIGGGSGDCAAALIALNGLWQLDQSENELLAICETLGADVPPCLSFLLHGKPLLMSGIGEKLELLNGLLPLNMVVVNNGTAIATPTVFAKLLEKNSSNLQKPPMTLSLAEMIKYLQTTRNDLSQPAEMIEPNLKQVLVELDQTGSLFSRMSGSGATCFGIYHDLEEAKRAAQKIRENHSHWFVKALIAA